jgi:hypothetical protein
MSEISNVPSGRRAFFNSSKQLFQIENMVKRLMGYYRIVLICGMPAVEIAGDKA